MPPRTVSAVARGRITTITLCRPHVRNAIDAPTAAQLKAAFESFDRDDSQHVAVLCAEGDNFCAGADLKALARGGGAALSLETLGPIGPTALELTKPVIVAVQGFAVAGGLELALWGDLRVADDTAVFGVFCRRFGVPLVDGGTVRLPRIVGHGRAMDMILTGRPVRAPEALQMGLVNRVVARGQAYAEAILLAEAIADFPQRTLRDDKQLATEQWSTRCSAVQHMERERELALAAAVAGREVAEGAAQFAAGAGRGGSKL